MMFTTNVLHLYWGQVILTTTYLINQLPSKIPKFRTPLDTFCDLYTNASFLSLINPKVFRRIVYVHNNNLSRTKLDPKALKCIFVGYSPSQKGYK